MKAGQSGISLRDTGIVDPSLGQTMWSLEIPSNPNYLILHQHVKTFASLAPRRLLASCDRDVGFSTCFLWPRGVGLQPRKTKVPPQCRYPQQKFFWSFRDCILLLLKHYLCHHPSLPQLLTLLWVPLRVLRTKTLHMCRASRPGSAVISIIAFGRIHIQDMNRGGNLGFFCFYSKLIAGEIIICM